MEDIASHSLSARHFISNDDYAVLIHDPNGIQPIANRYTIRHQCMDTEILDDAKRIISLESRERRTMIRCRAIETTPIWIADHQNNIIDHDYFDDHVFGTISCKPWIPNMDTIHIDDAKEYIDSIRVEQSCHESSYIAQPYDGGTGKIIPLYDGIGYQHSGIIDRKLRTITEYTNDNITWVNMMIRVLHNTYAYDMESRYVLMTRINTMNGYQHCSWITQGLRKKYALMEYMSCYWKE